MSQRQPGQRSGGSATASRCRSPQRCAWPSSSCEGAGDAGRAVAGAAGTASAGSAGPRRTSGPASRRRAGWPPSVSVARAACGTVSTATARTPGDLVRDAAHQARVVAEEHAARALAAATHSATPAPSGTAARRAGAARAARRLRAPAPARRPRPAASAGPGRSPRRRCVLAAWHRVAANRGRRWPAVRRRPAA